MKLFQFRTIIINVIFPLFIGGLIYIFFRSTSLRMFGWFETLGLNNLINEARIALSVTKNQLPKWVYFSLPDGLWVYSFTSALVLIWEGEFSYLKYWLVIPFFLGVVVEILQGINIFIGTFDVLDLSFSLIGFILSICVLKNKIEKSLLKSLT
jgi:hypothetical protein